MPRRGYPKRYCSATCKQAARYVPAPNGHLKLSAKAKRSKHKMTREDHIAMWWMQDCACALCGDAIALDGAHVDHDHACCPTAQSCGRCVRGLLCPNCNKGLGLFRDDPARLARALSYLTGSSVR